MGQGNTSSSATVWQPPTLPTLDQLPSWCMSTGAIDRSACVDVRLSAVRTLAGCKTYRQTQWPYGSVRTGVHPLPHERSACTFAGRVATGLFTITAHNIWHLFNRLHPHRLAGDFRTTRANAMRPEQFPSNRRHRNRYSVARTNMDRYYYNDWGNPNRGRGGKMLGLPHSWTQPLRIEKWTLERRATPMYYLICPGNPTVSGSLTHGRRLNLSQMDLSHNPAGASTRSRQSFRMRGDGGEDDRRCLSEAQASMQAWTQANADPRFPPLSNAPRGHKRRGCPQRVLKLMLPMCTKAEWRDSKIAWTWLNSLPPAAQARPDLARFITRLFDRYGLLFPPRTLFCRQCLGVHYGSHPDVARNGWWRRTRGYLPPT